jgi:hypothetical protein
MQGDDIRSDWREIPEDLKVTTISEIDDPDSCYSFDYFWTFQHNASGRVFYGQDSGCSCPSPFENDTFDGPDKTSFTEVTETNLEDYVRALWAHYDGHASLQDEKRETERKVRAIITK